MDSAWAGLLFISIATVVVGLPDLRDTPSDPVIVRMTDDAVLTCIVKDVDNYTVIWKKYKFGRAEVLSANMIKVSNDPRISIAQNEDKWILVIKKIRMTDTAQYICEVNSIPALQVSMNVVVTPPPIAAYPLSHNYTDCCVEKMVSSSCIGFCVLQNIVLGATGATPQSCREFLPRIAECMADGRNHMPCCVREKIPEVCRDVCVGKFGLVNETIVNHYTCSRYSRATLACIAEGIELLPGPPRHMLVEPISQNEIKVSWESPIQKIDTITHYVLNVTEMATFDGMSAETWEIRHEANSSRPDIPTKYTEITVNKSKTETTLKNLKPYTMYEIYIVSVNSYGTSLPTSSIRTLTLSKDEVFINNTYDNSTIPEIPDIRGCCAKKGMTQERCLDLFCDPVKADVTNLTDMMICAPWINTSVTCLVDGKDHTPCCRQRGLPELCLPLCEGKIERIDFRFFRCITFMSSYTNCLMQGYGVLASAPTKPFLRGLGPSWAVFEWSPPENLASTVTSYNFHYKSLNQDQSLYQTITKAKSPFIFNHIRPDTEYEVYVSAINQYGASEPSPRLEFQTEKVEEETNTTVDEESTLSDGYNFTECCIKSQINSSCTPLCSYKAKMADLQQLGPYCMRDFHKLLKCAVGGRDHVPCCMRRKISLDCNSLCSGVISHSSSAMAAICIPYIPDIIMCMEEGVSTLPGPIRELHVVSKNKSTILVEWLSPLEGNITHYEVRYQGQHDISRDQVAAPIENQVIIVNKTSVTITSLEENILYSVYVVSANEYGLSIPSSVVTFNTSSSEDELKGVVSSPYSLTVRRKNTTSILLTWLSPDFSHPTDALLYTVYFKSSNDTDFLNETTTTLMTLLSNLVPNTEYSIYVTAKTEKGESQPSEELIVWTDPVFPAFVEMPRVHPSTQIEEGGTMTILCVASGTPIPKVGVYISGRKIFEEYTRHLIARVSNISRDMNVISCTADNGVGVGSQATQRIKISYSPSIEGKRPQVRRIGEDITLECEVDGFPKPRVTWWRDQDKTTPVIADSRISFAQTQDDDGNDVFQLFINEAVDSDDGPYYCNADNPYGSSMDKVSLQLEPSYDINGNVSTCCIQEKVHPDCMDACTIDIDIGSVMNKEQCVPELSKLVYCAADGSDHRRCCQTWGISKQCISLCQGKQHFSFNVLLCILSWSKQIVGCFQEGKQTLPGVPENVRVKPLTVNSVFVQWDPPSKNPNMVQYYRVFAKPLNQKKPNKIRNDTHGLAIVMTGLKPGLTYEFSVKAGNHYGSSVLSKSTSLNLLDENVMEAVVEKDSDYTVAIIVAVVLTLLLTAVITFAFIYFKKRYRPPSPDAVSFENPSYMREIGTENAQANGTSNEHVNGGMRTTNESWKTEALQAPDFDNLYEVPSDDRAGLKKTASRPGYM